MFQRDFILRMIEEMAKFVTLVLKMKNTGEQSKAYNDVKKMTEKFTGLSYESLVNGDIGVDDLNIKEDEPVEYVDAKGQFFLVAGELCIDLNKRAEAQKLFETALYFYKNAESMFDTFSFQRQVDISKIKEYLSLMGAP